MVMELSRDTPPAVQPHVDPFFRDLYTRFIMQTGLEKQTILGVSSAVNGEGKTTIAVNLARALASDRALAESGQRKGNILLVECNQVQSRMSEEFRVAAAPGLVHYLQGGSRIGDVIKATDLAKLWIMPNGGIVPRFPILIRTPGAQQSIQKLRDHFDFIIVDLPSVLTSTDLHVLAKFTDHILLVVRSGVTPVKLVNRAVEEVGRDKLAGLVLNDYRAELPNWLEHRL